MQIRRIFKSSHQNPSSHRSRSRHPKIQAAIDDQFKRLKRSSSVDPNATIKDDQTTTTTDDGYRSGSSAVKRRNNHKQQRATSVVRIHIENFIKSFIFIGCSR